MNWVEKIPKKSENIAWRIIDGEAIVIPLLDQPQDGERFNVFNETATAIWELIDGKKSIKNIIIIIAADYNMDFSSIEGEVKSSFNKLARKKLIEYL